jgi:hypothetical protein
MSLVKVSGNASGTGTLTIAAPNTNSDYTLLLPANTGTLLSTASEGQVIPKAALPTGSILQVVNATYTTNVTTSSSTYTDTGLTATITPLFSTSKILVIVSQNGNLKGGANNTRTGLQLFRNASSLTTWELFANWTNTATLNAVGTSGFEYLDSPATTSATTYKTQFNSQDNVASVSVQAGSAMSTITLMEIAA